MEAVLKVRVPGMVCMPWKQVVRGCLVFVMFGILYLCVQNCAQKCETVPAVPESSAAKYRTAAALKDADLPGICENVRCEAADMRKNLAVLPENLSLAVKAMPVQAAADTGENTVSAVAERTTVMPETIPVPVVSVELPDNRETAVTENFADTSVPLPVITEESPVDIRETESVVIENPPVVEEIELPAEDLVPEEVAGFTLDSEGYITGCTERVVIRDDLLLIPESDRCVGIRSGALNGLGTDIMEVYLPANISDIEPGAFDAFPFLMYVEVSGDNPYFYSVDGILYSLSGDIAVYPAGRQFE